MRTTESPPRSRRTALFLSLLLAVAGFVTIGASPALAASGNMLPPFDIGQTWNICQGYNGPISHTGTSLYGLDLTGAGCDNSAAGRNVRAPISGTVSYYQAAYGNLCVNITGSRSYTLTHIDSSITSGSVAAGQVVGTVAAAGSRGNNNLAHLHFQIWAASNCYNSSVIPFDTAHGARICGAPDLTATGPDGGNGTWSGTSFTGADCGTPPPPPPPITQPNGSTYLKADFNGDGKTDIGTAIGPNETDIWVWLSNGTTFAAPTRWWNGAGNGVMWSKVKPFAMDFNGDGKTDVGMLHDLGGSRTLMWAWISTGSSFTTPTVPIWDSGAGNFNLATATPVVGDFNGDGKPDVVAATDNGAGSTDLWVWPSSGSSLGAPVRWWNGAGNGVVWSKIKLFAYDSNLDGKTDIGMFQDGGSSRTFIWAWLSTGSAFTTPTVPLWDSGAGNYNLATATPVVADFNGDGKVDVSAINGLSSGGSSDIWVWSSTGTALAAPVRWWNGAGNGVAWSKIKPFAGDFNGDGKADFGDFEDAGTFWTRVWIWNSTGSAFVTPTSPAWDSGLGNYNAATSTPVS